MTPAEPAEAEMTANPSPHTFGLFPPILYPINLRDWEVDAGPGDVSAIGQLADQFGYSFIACGDHGALATSELALYGRARFYDPIATLGFFAATTSTIKLVTLIFQAHLRSPLIAAKEFATLDHLSGGRVIAGFGVGSRKYEADAAGVEFTKRGAIVDDHIQAMKALWSNEVASYEGEFVRFSDLICEPRPTQLPWPRIWIGGNRKLGLRRALRIGDGWAPFGAGPEQITEVLTSALENPEWQNRPAGFQVIVPLTPLGGRAPRGMPAPAFDEPGDEAAERAAESVRRWLDTGATDFIVDLPAPSRAGFDEALEWYAKVAAPMAGLSAAGT
jgi:probable F420-dependent oxidoreductase